MKHPIAFSGYFGIAALVLTFAFFGWAVVGNWLCRVKTAKWVYAVWWLGIAVCAALNYLLYGKFL